MHHALSHCLGNGAVPRSHLRVDKARENGGDFDAKITNVSHCNARKRSEAGFGCGVGCHTGKCLCAVRSHGGIDKDDVTALLGEVCAAQEEWHGDA